MKGNPEPYKMIFSRRDDATLGNPLGAFRSRLGTDYSLPYDSRAGLEPWSPLGIGTVTGVRDAWDG